MILMENLGMKKVCVKMVPKNLTNNRLQMGKEFVLFCSGLRGIKND
jgi:hypothetical protein